MKKLFGLILIAIASSSTFAAMTITNTNFDFSTGEFYGKVQSHFYTNIAGYPTMQNAAIDVQDKNKNLIEIQFTDEDLAYGENLSNAIGKNVLVRFNNKGQVSEIIQSSYYNSWIPADVKRLS